MDRDAQNRTGGRERGKSRALALQDDEIVPSGQISCLPRHGNNKKFWEAYDADIITEDIQPQALGGSCWNRHGTGDDFWLDTSIINTVSGAVVAASSVITYILAEGKIDAAAVKAAIEAAQKAKDAITDSEVGDAE